MKNLIITAIVGLLLFGASFAGSSFMLSQNQTEEEKDNEATVDENTDDGSQPMVTDTSAPAGTRDVAVPFKTKSLSEEAILNMVKAIRLREAELTTRENNVYQRESKHQFILNDIQREKRELEALQQQVEGKIIQADRILKMIQDKQREIELAKAEIQNLTSQLEKVNGPEGQAERKALKKIAQLFAGMPAENAAETIKQYANDGRLDAAASILSQIEERNAAKILTALGNTTLVTQLLEEMKNNPPSPTQKR